MSPEYEALEKIPILFPQDSDNLTYHVRFKQVHPDGIMFDIVNVNDEDDIWTHATINPRVLTSTIPLEDNIQVLRPHEVLLKDYSENEELPEILIKAGIVCKSHRSFNGYPIYKLNVPKEDNLNNVNKTPFIGDECGQTFRHLANYANGHIQKEDVSYGALQDYGLDAYGNAQVQDDLWTVYKIFFAGKQIQDLRHLYKVIQSKKLNDCIGSDPLVSQSDAWKRVKEAGGIKTLFMSLYDD